MRCWNCRSDLARIALMEKNKGQFGVRDLLVAVTLFSTAACLVPRLPRTNYWFFLGLVFTATLLGASYGSLTHRLWHGIFLGIVAAGLLDFLLIISLL